MLDEQEQKVYNTYLRALADKNQRPYKPRKDFSKLREKDVLQIKKLKFFFDNYKDVNPYQFFKAGFKYEVNTYPTLEYFNTIRATKVYSKFIREKYYDDVDNIESIKDFKDGILFIYNFIAENDITLMDYKTCLNESGVPWCSIHLKRQDISFYHIHSLEIPIDTFSEDYREMITDDFENVFYETKESYYNSKIMREIGDKFNKFSYRLLKANKQSQNYGKINSTASNADSSSEE